MADYNVTVSMYGGSAALKTTTEAKTSDYTVTAGDTGKHFTNRGAVATVTFDLPSAASGLRYRFSDLEAQTISIDPAAGDTLYCRIGGGLQTATNGTPLSGTSASSWIEIVAESDSVWVATAHNGLWTD